MLNFNPMNLLASGDNPLTHVVDTPRFFGWVVSDVTLLLIFSGLLLIILIPLAARRIKTGEARTVDDYRTQGLWANMIESVCVYLREEVFKPMLGKDADRFAPLLWTFFFFILLNNLLGLVPLRDITGLIQGFFGFKPWGSIHGFGGTATQSIFVTAALAVIAFIVINGTALARDPIGYVKHLTAGAPVALWPLMVPIELLGTFVKPFALAMRLFANMTGGHIVVAVMFMFVKMLVVGLQGVGYIVSILPIGAVIGIYFLEVLVAFIQAFVFVFLVALFLGQLIHHEDHDHAHGDHHDPLAEPYIGNSATSVVAESKDGKVHAH